MDQLGVLVAIVVSFLIILISSYRMTIYEKCIIVLAVLYCVVIVLLPIVYHIILYVSPVLNSKY